MTHGRTIEMRRALGTVTAALGIAALAFAGAPATAATLPATDSIYILPCDADAHDGILYRVDPVSGQATRVGTWANPDENTFSCAGPGSYNPTDGKGYWISWAEDNHGFLISVDLSTGVNTNIGEFTLEGLPFYTPLALTIDGAGNAWATSWSLSPDVLFSVNLATAELTEVGPTGVVEVSQNYGLAWDRVTNAVYAYNVTNHDFYTVNTTTGAFTLFNDDVMVTQTPYAIGFDSAGNVWGIAGDIVSAPLANLDDTQNLAVINPYPESEGDIFSESIIIAPAPALAATGADNSASALVAGAGVLLVIGGIVIARRRATA
jgi:LPXTG-motif cell wall-anchored protein